MPFFRADRRKQKRASRIHLSEVAYWREPEYIFGFTGWKSMDGKSGMEALETLNIPTRAKHLSAIQPGVDFQIYPQPPICKFELRHADEFCWYECSHCKFCGCPSFPLSDLKDMPAEVMDHLKLHAELCSKLER